MMYTNVTYEKLWYGKQHQMVIDLQLRYLHPFEQ